MTTRTAPLATLLAATAIAAGGVGCSSDGVDEDDPPADLGTVLPPDDVGVGGGVPVDNLQPNVADQERQNIDDVDGDGDPEP